MPGPETLLDSSCQHLSISAQALWAKSGDETGWLTLAQHMLDSACVAEWLWDEWVPKAVRTTMSRLSGLDEADTRTLAIWLAGVHDIGKATISFQTMPHVRPDGSDFTEQLRRGGLPLQMSELERNTPNFRHAVASHAILSSWLVCEPQTVHPSIARGIAQIADAHHGVSSELQVRNTASVILSGYAPEWTSIQEELLDWMADITGLPGVLPRTLKAFRGPAQNLYTGLVIVADWIASNSDAFPMMVQRSQRERTERGLQKLDLTPPWIPPIFNGDSTEYMREMFDWPTDRKPRPIQTAVVDAVCGIHGPALVLIEAPTGEGKTETALTAAGLLAHACGSGGVIIAAPTMSTANGLFERFLEWVERSTARGQVTSMYLAHSKNTLSREYTELKHTSVNQDELDEATHGSVIASEWMSGRKRGLLSEFTVATVDQILLMALQSKHVMLRQLGLSAKVVIIDEVHAYDSYMSEYLHTALAWLATYGVPVILLSATLPESQKLRLLNAYGGNLDLPPVESTRNTYPLVTTISSSGVRETTVRPRRTELNATVEIIDDDVSALGERMACELADGGCALIVCNTVARSQQAFLEMTDRFPGEVTLHHSAFIACDRISRETELRTELGPQTHRGSGRPLRRVIVSTQTAEQSLDVDADILITDIAPIDLVIQRIGRLHRHKRPESDRPPNLRSPRILVRGILGSAHSFSVEQLSVELPIFDAGSTFVYGEKLLIAALSVLRERVLDRGLRRPDDIADLVQCAYSDAPPIPTSWLERWELAVAEGQRARESARTRAQGFLFPQPNVASTLDKQFKRQHKDVGSASGEAAGLAQVRDSDPTIEVIPIVRTSSGYRPLPWLCTHDAELVMNAEPPRPFDFILAASTVRLPTRFSKFSDVFRRVLDNLKQTTPSGWQKNHLLNGQVALLLDRSLETIIDGRLLVYDRNLGLVDYGPPNTQFNPQLATCFDTRENS